MTHPGAVGIDGRGDGGVGFGGFDRVRPAATTRLAARRATSHSNGPGNVSSKSRRSKLRLRSGVAHSPKFKMCASPQSWTSRRLCGSRGEIGGHHGGGTAVEFQGDSAMRW